MTHCPVCKGAEVVETVTRDRIPTMQNRVYRTREEARAARAGRLELAACRACGFAWNRAFDPTLVVYDDAYDNSVPSAVMAEHYRDIARRLVERHDLREGLVLDVGCGNGAFLREIRQAVPGSRGLGVDPALDGDGEEDGGGLRYVRAMFDPGLLDERPALIVCRHVLEHLPDPVEFLRTIHAAATRFGAPSPCFLEVPDLGWIVRNEAFSDLCYEHSNYFTAGSLAGTARRAGFTTVAADVAFGSQYLVLEAVPAPAADGSDRPADDVAGTLLDYAGAEAATIASTRERLIRRRSDGDAIAVWGMATKGVMFSLLVDPDGLLIDHCVDVNPNKQDAFVPITGHRIGPPEDLRNGDGRPVAVVVMNVNYRGEIEATCRGLELQASFVDLHGSGSP
jgi:hypothetical protein